MPKKQSSKEKILTVRVSQAQYKKIQDLAYIRSMNVTEYIRQTACLLYTSDAADE